MLVAHGEWLFILDQHTRRASACKRNSVGFFFLRPHGILKVLFTFEEQADLLIAPGLVADRAMLKQSKIICILNNECERKISAEYSNR